MYATSHGYMDFGPYKMEYFLAYFKIGNKNEKFELFIVLFTSFDF